MNIIVYDLETQKTFAEISGQPISNLLVSYLGLYSYSQDKYFGFFEKDLPKLEQIIKQEQPTIVGFNSISFDNPVLQPYFNEVQMKDLPQVDILAEIFDRLGYRMKLESVAQATLAEGKSGSGLDAIRYYREGNLDALAKYCQDDVRITKELFDYGREHGYILYSSGGDIHQMPVSWSTEETIDHRLKKAHAEHKRVKIVYLEVKEGESPNRITTEVDIISLSDKNADVFCHHSNAQRDYAVNRILSAELTETQYAHQATLI